METAIIAATGLLFSVIQCFDSESFEYNGIEVSPLYETIIYSDIADIINEFENNNIAPEKLNNESESDEVEDVEDLLSEYHHYLEKAHKQRVNYLEKNKLKNKVPMIYHDKFTKMKSDSAGKHKDHYKSSFYNSDHKFTPVNYPLNMFIPYNSNKFLTTSEEPAYSDIKINKILLSGGNLMSTLSSTGLPCNKCIDGQTSCKQCSKSIDHLPVRNNQNTVLPLEDKVLNLNNAELSEDTINIRIKVDVQLPKFQQDHVQFYNMQSRDKMTDYDTGISKEYLSAIKLPSPFFNFPIPMNLLGYKKMPKFHKNDVSAHKLTVHKKKKSKASNNNNNKKHRKKLITFHNIKIEPQMYQAHFGKLNLSNNIKNDTESNNIVILNLQTNKTLAEDVNLTTTSPISIFNVTKTQTEENILLLANITSNVESVTNNKKYKIENSIETEYTNTVSNDTTDSPTHLLKKREIPSKTTMPPKQKIPLQKLSPAPEKETTKTIKKSTKLSKSKTLSKKTSVSQKPSSVKKKALSQSFTTSEVKPNSTQAKQDNKINTKLDKMIPADTELLYWPNNNGMKLKDLSKNITAIILENETKKVKLNMTSETLRRNHTRALEQAIFGNVDWNDVDTVAPAFISFIGKYIEGILTFCNELICQSMKCTKKKCLHRVCKPQERFNNIGHCIGSNLTDSAASMESIMDLPSNIAFEIVDILHDRMNGKLYGKATLCINSKCITFSAYKKAFLKVKCTVKELSHQNHCANSKDNKVA